MKKSTESSSRFISAACSRGALALFLCVSVTLWSGPLRAATDGKEAAAQWLQAQLPKGTSLQQADCETLIHAVSRATLDHRPEAPAILRAALTHGSTAEVPRKEEKRPLECLSGIVLASVKAAPEQASAVLDVATALYPESASALAAIFDQAMKDLTAYNYRDAKDYKDAPVAGINNVGTSSVATGGFGNGFGAGFAGAPGASGSDPSGGLALPPAGTAVVTNTLNQ